MKIVIASDHRGFKTKGKLVNYLMTKRYDVIDLGTFSPEAVDYPEFAFKVGETVAKKEATYGILLCGSGIGMSIACNKVKGVRCAKVSTVDEAYYTRYDNDANVIALDEGMPFYTIKDIIDKFLSTNFSNVERHMRRIESISDYEEGLHE